MKRQKSYLFKNTVFKEGNESAKTIFSGPGGLEVGPAPEFEGSPQTLNPEEMFVAAINNCLMTTFFYFVRKSNVEILSYCSDAEGRVEKQADGFRFTNMEVPSQENIFNVVFHLSMKKNPDQQYYDRGLRSKITRISPQNDLDKIYLDLKSSIQSHLEKIIWLGIKLSLWINNIIKNYRKVKSKIYDSEFPD